MRIYVPEFPVSKLNEERIAEKRDVSCRESLIISTSGIFRIKDDDIMRLKIRDVRVTETNVGNFRVLLDSSKWEFDEPWCQIPVEHTHEISIRKEYILRKGALVKLVIEERNQKNTDFYFSTDEDIGVFGVREDILTFLSQLKFC
jgi:hypothetical protein